MQPTYRPRGSSQVLGSRATGTDNASATPLPSPHVAIESVQPAKVAMPAPQPPPTLLARLQVACGLIWGLRRTDLQAARAFVRLKYVDQPFVVRWFRFVGWALRQAVCEIPKAMQCLTIDGPVSDTPVWLKDHNPLTNHPWADSPQAEFPKTAETVVIGAGFTGGALAYHWSKCASSDRQMVVLEMNDPASGSSGRNEGLVVMGRYFSMVRDAMYTHLKNVRDDLSDVNCFRLAEQFADRYCRAAYRNADLIENTVREERFDCDYVRAGWVQVREVAEQHALAESVQMAIESGYTDWTALGPDEAHRRSGIRVECPTGFSQSAASWHPAKWVWCLLQRAIQSDNVALFTRTKVTRVMRQGDHYEIHTERGMIQACHVVYATETYTPKLDGRLSGVILPVQEQAACGIAGLEEMPLRATVSGSWFFAGRHGRRVVFGSGGPRVSDDQAGRNRPSRFLTKFVAGELLRLFGAYKLFLTNEWSGTTGYTPDGYPIVGQLDGNGLYVIGGMSGSGSAIAFNAGRYVVNRILSIRDDVDDYPPEYFAPSRLVNPKCHSWPQIHP